ncbi:NAD(P)H-binding protein [Actinoalloteichus hymeniacidonis]|uniref:NAD(P)-binding domain-containing protein n=1 Tax=Actinoalloteichus hymeniacidonis TaxID=340345 RepID=A0AAC9MYC2_9PSEU|nr:NAD(P)H-binding protein [Actinoalloteichus hymeniacidonis]AOS64273.1 hypothetical protein TL08_17365 [Actinoalloteichus hymeniacidonis]MBB5907659.1 uncharacterized protein YbjT (DUF2867 family) [Actinoalloteichus hymeniacidonis]
MRADDPILVIGATGNVGRQVVTQLNDQGVPVRALTRNPATAGLPTEVDVREGDLTDQASLIPALAGIRAVFLVWPLDNADHAPEVISAIAAHTRRIVYLSSSGVDEHAERQADPINQFHADLEATIQAQDLEWTFLRAGGFAANDLGWATEIRSTGMVRDPFPSATRAVLHEADIAAAGIRALLGTEHIGGKPVLIGTETLSNAQRVQIIGEVIGRPIQLEEISRQDAREQMLAEGWPADLVDGLLAAHAEMEVAVEVLDATLVEIIGRPARTYREWVTDHLADFR